nr:hypothetical protein [Tanacetum cinerariifolium]
MPLKKLHVKHTISWSRRATLRFVSDGTIAWGTRSRDFWNGGAALSAGYGPLDGALWFGSLRSEGPPGHHDSDVYDAFPDNDFSIQDVHSLTERIIELRPVPSGLLFGAELATTWEFLVFFLFSKIPKGMVISWFKNARIIAQIARITILHLRFCITTPNARPCQIALAIDRNSSHLFNASSNHN